MISDDRKKHIWAVAEMLKGFAVEQGMSEEETFDLYTIGLLHDIGYEFVESEEYVNHNVIGGNLLKLQGFIYWKEIYYHGVANSPYQSHYLDLLNWADMHTDSVGKYVSYDERLSEISIKYGVAIEELSSFKVVQELKQKGFE